MTALDADVALQLADDARTRAGVLLIALVAVEYGGTFLLRVSRGRQPASPLQQSFFRAGHAHAGVLVVLALVCQLYLSAANLDGFVESLAGQGVALAAILMPAGFFLSVVGTDVERPNRLVVLIWLGAVSLAAGVVALGVGLLTAG